MELMYPIVIVICVIIVAIMLILNKKKKEQYVNGKKVANTKYIKETKYYKEKIKKYKIISSLIKLISVLCIIISSVLIARPITVQTKAEDKYNRDIMIGLDISNSQSEVKQIIPQIKGDRIGIVLFNTSPVVYCPLTDDYDYINNCIDKIEEQLKLVINNNGHIPTIFDEEGIDAITFWTGGVMANSDQKGSSLVGDGLAGTVYSFTELKTNKSRTRIIIFATDNAVEGTESVTLEDACTLCNKYNVNLYAYCPTEEMNIHTSKTKIAQYRKAVENNANGKFYIGNLNQMTMSIVNEIKETKTSLLKSSKKTFVTDHPEIPFISIVLLFLTLIILEKRIKL